ncbi:MAG: hypothetical protein AUH42_00615 [Gemmatimonadetes bacterium 13_1_40CM_70_11]|nr:MAG: hypothetical protein AUH42_00615 [Gemmatimonadetes bacterium 13_1_40CM_70_11]
MVKRDPERRLTTERRRLPARRENGERRSDAEGESLAERRAGGDRRQVSDRRSAVERRLSLHSAVDQIHGALKLLTLAAESEAATLSEEQRRALEGAMLRLRFALERLEEE